MSQLEVKLNFASRHKKTNVYTAEGKTFFGVWDQPIIKLDGDEKVVKVSSDQLGQLDLIAYQEYENRALWWVIAQANGIRSVTDQVVAGIDLTIPKIANVRAALLEQRNAINI